MLLLWILGTGAVAALTARFYFGITVERAVMYVAMRTPVGQMIHDMNVSKARATQHSKPAIYGERAGEERNSSFVDGGHVNPSGFLRGRVLARDNSHQLQTAGHSSSASYHFSTTTSRTLWSINPLAAPRVSVL